QETFIPALLGSQSDALLAAPPGEGKTLSFLLPVLAGIDNRAPGVQALVVAPHAEAALQTLTAARTLTRGGSKRRRAAPVTTAALVRPLHKAAPLPDAHLVVATPSVLASALADSPAFRDVVLPRLNTLVLDEFDYLAAFERRALEGILTHATIKASHVTRARSARIRKAAAPRVIGVSATMATPSVREVVADHFAAPHLELDVAERRADAPAVEHLALLLNDYASHDGRARGSGVSLGVTAAALAHTASRLKVKRSLVFTHDAADGRALADELKARGFKAGWLPPGASRAAAAERKRMLAALAAGRLQLALLPDVVARGLDLPTLTHVFSVGLPANVDQYVHRAGRVGRPSQAAAAPTVVSLVRSARDFKALDHIAESLGITPSLL
ncbi:cold-shock DEAD-box protein A, partial [Thecamonas trahens ATCC 50062]